MADGEKKSFLDRMIERVDKLDANSVQAYILHLSRERGFFETVFNAVQEGILVVDRRLKIRYHNRAAKELLGLPDDLEKIRLSQFLQNVDWRRILKLDEEEWTKMSRQEVEILYPQHRYLQFYLVPHHEETEFATVILRDVTESRTRTLQELETETINFIAMLAGEVAHEVGNPLNSLYLNLQLLNHMAEKDGDFDMDDAKEMLTACRDEVERLDNIINQFLHAIRPGKQKLKKVNVKDLLIETLNFMQKEIEIRDVEIKCHFPDVLPILTGNASRLKQAFFNILRNAVQSMPQGGSIDVTCSYDDDYVMIEFADTGQGISSERLNRIFDPFKSFRKGGTGLGMMIIEKVMREHGAEMTIETKENEGTSVIIRFPRPGRRVRVLPEADENIPEQETEDV
ncbi:MAG: PAS domain-containing protein [Lentisphaerae bacterium]|nr:PAS domain-containing protein [Lentisphaerota bacterium]MCP4101518.1 PAS domain-containing protein [Lentisphaerota bacterium]